MADADIMGGLLSLLEEKYDCTQQILMETRSLEKAVNIRSQEEIGTALELRGQAIERAQQLDQEMKEKAALLSPILRQRVEMILAPGSAEVKMEDPLEYTIFDENRRIVILMRQIAELDMSIRRKMEGRRY